MPEIARKVFGNMRFRLEIEGMSETGATEIIFPEARVADPASASPRVQYGILVLRRGVTLSREWYGWWDLARTSKAGGDRKNIAVVLQDESGAETHRWTFNGARPHAYALSPLNALGNEPLIETLELTVDSFEATYA
jgi:phage tail-like protein